MSEHANDNRPRKSLRESVCDIDRDILRLLMRRHNLLRRMYNAKGHLEPAEEKFLRESWEAGASRLSRDPRLSSRFFTLMQEVEFLPRPEDEPAEKRPAFNLAPSTSPVRLDMRAPLACRATRAWLYLAAAAGQPLRLTPCLMNDPIVDCVKMLNQLGAALTREGNGVCVLPAQPLGAPDKVIHVGDSAWNFYMMLGHFLGRPSRAKFIGDTSLRLADFSVARRFVGQMGARMVQTVPRCDGLPVRLECSGVLPESVRLPADAPVELAEGILLAAPFYARPLRLDLTDLPQRDLLLTRTLPILQQAGADVRLNDAVISITPSRLAIPQTPELPLEAELGLGLLALSPALGGTVRLEGSWPATPEADAGKEWLRQLGCAPSFKNGAVTLTQNAPLASLPAAALPTAFPTRWQPFALAVAALVALRSGTARLPEGLQNDENFRTDAQSFFHALQLHLEEDGTLRRQDEADSEAPQGRGWNAPTPVWAMALAIAACARGSRQQVRLGNPGDITALFPAFWQLYNSLPAPQMEREPEPAPATPQRQRRRIITSALAEIPELPDEE